jgi:hypothetical protein
MLKGNLATRPFYNERIVGFALVAVVVLAVLLTALNAQRLAALTRERTALAGQIDQDRAEAARINGETQALQRSVDRATLRALAADTHEANDLIARRTFSWTAFFGLIERTLPIDVRLVAVSPRTDRGTFRIQMSIIARDFEHIDEFTSALLATGAFKDVVPLEQRPRPEDGTIAAQIEGLYYPLAAAPATSRPVAAPPTPAESRP